MQYTPRQAEAYFLTGLRRQKREMERDYTIAQAAHHNDKDGDKEFRRNFK